MLLVLHPPRVPVLLHRVVLQALQLLRQRVQLGQQLRVLAVLLVVLHEHLARRLVEGALGEGHDQ